MKFVDPDPVVLDRVIRMAWEDDTPFEAIALQFGLREADVIVLMRRHLKRGSFQMWRKRVAGRNTKHRVLHDSVTNAPLSDDQPLGGCR